MIAEIKTIYDRCLQAKLKILENDYSRTGSSLFIWEMINFCLSKKIAFPDIVHKYLSETSEEVISVELSDTSERYKAICNIFKLVGGHPFAQYSKEKEVRLYVVSYYCLLMLHAYANDIPSEKIDRDLLKKQVREDVATGMKLSVRDDRTFRNWIKDFKISEDDILSHFVDEHNLMNEEFPNIPAVLPLVIHENPSFLSSILSQFD